ncbi:hypothetical protein AWZ03_012262 [Drosophila navojoa]|uniref:Uncharacterized protein n=1 Tax=Drosophila navojoa TaxID=7232 RepID=A0A484AZ87_DRONA|nr:hypothetical protein AWZ03_012262 [Drosophila navojoa]
MHTDVDTDTDADSDSDTDTDTDTEANMSADMETATTTAGAAAAAAVAAAAAAAAAAAGAGAAGETATTASADHHLDILSIALFGSLPRLRPALSCALRVAAEQSESCCLTCGQHERSGNFFIYMHDERDRETNGECSQRVGQTQSIHHVHPCNLKQESLAGLKADYKRLDVSWPKSMPPLKAEAKAAAAATAAAGDNL